LVISESSKYNATYTIPNQKGNYNITIIANDTDNNLNNTIRTNFSVEDTIIPEVVDTAPTAGSLYNISDLINISANVTDNAAVDVVIANITLPNGSITLLTLINGVSSRYNNTFTVPILIGTYNLTFFANDSSNNINYTVKTNFTVEQQYGSLNVTLNTPTPNTTTNVNQTQIFLVNATITCTGEIGALCGNVTAYARYNTSSGGEASAGWWNTSWLKRKEIDITNVGTTLLTDFPAYINVSKETGMQADFDDLRFINGSCDSTSDLELNYEIENYTANNAHVWLRIPSLATGINSICMYYNNSVASSGENMTGVCYYGYVVVSFLVWYCVCGIVFAALADHQLQ